MPNVPFLAPAWWPERLRLDRFTLAMAATLLAATLMPAQGALVPEIDRLGYWAIVALFFLHGGSLPAKETLASLRNWRVHALVVASTFLLFPLLGLAIASASKAALEAPLYTGLLYLCCLPSTVQSSIALTAMARGNVAAAVCAASASNLLGVFLTPLLVGLLLARHGAMSWETSAPIFTTILLPFVLGQLSRPLIGRWLARHKRHLALIDRAAILIMVYAAFGKAITGGLWSAISPGQIAFLTLICAALLACALAATRQGAALARISDDDTAAAVFCGSMKSLVTGVPMAMILFPHDLAGVIVIPLMIYHQMQLIVCAWLARRRQRRIEPGGAPGIAAT